MQRQTFSRLAGPFAALALCASFAGPALAQRGQDNAGDQAREAPGQRQAPPRQREADSEQVRPKEQAAKEAQQQARRQEAAKDAEQQARRQGAAPSVRPYPVRSGDLRERLSNGDSGRELRNGMAGEVNINRDRMARLQRLRRIYEARQDERQLRRLDQLEENEMRRYQNLMGEARGKLSEEEYSQFLEHVGDPRLPNQVQGKVQEQRRERLEDQP